MQVLARCQGGTARTRVAVRRLATLSQRTAFRVPAVRGTLTLTALPLQGLRPPAPMTLTLRPDQPRLRADLAYDTGIR